MTTLFQIHQAVKIAENVYQTDIEGLLFIQHKTMEDNRGFYKELTLLPDLELHLSEQFIPKQINQARSNAYVTRGLHAENWNKLVTVTNGNCFCALADIRPDSKTYKQVITFNLGTTSNSLAGSIFIPKGIANSMCVTEGPVDYLYIVDALYRERDTSNDVAISLFDPELSIEWPISKQQMILSERDMNAITLKEKYSKNP